MDHWFDRLAGRTTRRTALVHTGAAAAALALPLGRAATATATQNEKCFTPCLKEAREVLVKDWGVCTDKYGGTSYQNILAGAPIDGLLHLLRRERRIACRAEAMATFNRNVSTCHYAQCGDPAKYPGGNAPAEICTPNLEIQCGNICCNATGSPECCFCKKTGEYRCCANGSGCSCCGS